MNNKDRMTTVEAAEYLGLSTGSLSNMRSIGNGPDFYKMGGIFYKQTDLDIFIESRRRSSSSKKG